MLIFSSQTFASPSGGASTSGAALVNVPLYDLNGDDIRTKPKACKWARITNRGTNDGLGRFNSGIPFVIPASSSLPVRVDSTVTTFDIIRISGDLTGIYCEGMS